MKSGSDVLIVTNNPLVHKCMAGHYTVRLREGFSLPEVLVHVRDLVYSGHTLLTHPLSGSVKPNETPYKSVVVSKTPHAFSAEQAEIIANSIAGCGKFAPKKGIIDENTRYELQLVDFTLLAAALDFDAEAYLSKQKIADNAKEGGRSL